VNGAFNIIVTRFPVVAKGSNMQAGSIGLHRLRQAAADNAAQGVQPSSAQSTVVAALQHGCGAMT
jgi:hypothetical protein